MAVGLELSVVNELTRWVFNSAYSANRWLHLVATTLLVGGVLFFTFVVPTATSDLKVEHQLAVFGKARWLFRTIVVWSILAIFVTGVFSLRRMWSIYKFDAMDDHSYWVSPITLAIAHIVAGVIAAMILIRLTATRRLLGHPIGWLRAVLTLLLLTMLLASIARQLALNIDDERIAEMGVVNGK